MGLQARTGPSRISRLSADTASTTLRAAMIAPMPMVIARLGTSFDAKKRMAFIVDGVSSTTRVGMQNSAPGC